MEKIIVSACLLGEKCRYDGKGNYVPLIEKIKEKYEIIMICPETMGGLPTPRIPSEIQLDGKIRNQKGKDVTRAYLKGVDQVLTAIKYFGVKKAILKEKSPACGVHQIHSGNFDDKLIDGQGILTSKLLELGVEVYNELEIENLLEN